MISLGGKVRTGKGGQAGDIHLANSGGGLLQVLADLFSGQERLLFAGVFAVSLIAAAVETAGVATILPFMALVVDSGSLDRYGFLQDFARDVGVMTHRGMLLLFGGITIAVVALGNFASALNLIAQQRFIAHSTERLATSIFGGYLQQPYGFHVQRDAPSLMKVVLTDVRVVMSGVVTPFLQALSRGLMAVGVLALLFAQNAVLALTLATVVGGAYGLIYTFARGRQRRLGMEFNRNNELRHRIAQESLGGVKDLIVLGRTRHAADRFREAEHAAAITEAGNNIMAQLPRYALEALAFGAILLLTMIMVASGTAESSALVPLLALYAFAGYRLMPAVQQVFHSAAKIRFSVSALYGVHADLRQVVRGCTNPCTDGSPINENLSFERELMLDGITFTYSGAERPALRDVSVSIHPGESIGIVGRTGSGKTTLADVILGLYEPSGGTIQVDGVLLSRANVRQWQNLVGYVPQQVFLANASIAANIAFGVPIADIDHDAVRRAAHLAQAADFIVALPSGFDTVVGERGVRLSGGQRQRLGVARALYMQPAVLVFDEATSALDGLTEEALMHEVNALSGERTVILIAHRLRTVQACNRIIVMDEGRIAAEGDYQHLAASSGVFRELVKAAASSAFQSS